MTKIYDNYLMVKPIQTGLTESHEDTLKKKKRHTSIFQMMLHTVRNRICTVLMFYLLAQMSY